jgi:hypothetical protein
MPFRFSFHFSLSFFSLFGVFRLHANKAKKTTVFRFKSKTKIPTFSLIFALSEYERRTLTTSQPGSSATRFPLKNPT